MDWAKPLSIKRPEAWLAGTVPLAAELREAIAAYADTDEPAAEARAALLSLLGHDPLAVPADQVTEIEVKRSLELRAQQGVVEEIRVTLFTNGLLALEEGP